MHTHFTRQLSKQSRHEYTNRTVDETPVTNAVLFILRTMDTKAG